MITEDTKLDSREGIEHLFKWARAHRFVLDPIHERIARKHSVSTDGVVISHPIPLAGTVAKTSTETP